MKVGDSLSIVTAWHHKTIYIASILAYNTSSATYARSPITWWRWSALEVGGYFEVDTLKRLLLLWIAIKRLQTCWWKIQAWNSNYGWRTSFLGWASLSTTEWINIQEGCIGKVSGWQGAPKACKWWNCRRDAAARCCREDTSTTEWIKYQEECIVKVTEVEKVQQKHATDWSAEEKQLLDAAEKKRCQEDSERRGGVSNSSCQAER